MYMNGAVLCYTRIASGGINCISLDIEYGPYGGRIQFGSTVVVSKGGAYLDNSALGSAICGFIISSNI